MPNQGGQRRAAPIMRGVAPEVSAQRACERSSERGRGAASSPDPERLQQTTIGSSEGLDRAYEATTTAFCSV